MSSQLPLDLGLRTALGREDFLIGTANRDAVAWIDLWPDWPAPGLVIHGPAGCGKSHLAELWRVRSGAVRFEGGHVDAASVEGLARDQQSVVVEDIDRPGGDELNPRALLHLHNLLAERGGHLLITTRVSPARLDIALPDLRSRILALPAVEVGPPDDELIGVVLVKQFADRQLRVAPGVVAYLVARIERSFAAVRRVVEALDAAALADRRNITVALARDALRAEGLDNQVASESGG